MSKIDFIYALENNSIIELQAVPKSDLHNHAGRGGHISYMENMLKMPLPRRTEPFGSLEEMDVWFENNIKGHFPSKHSYIIRIGAAFVQAKVDNIAVLSLCFGVGEAFCLGNLDMYAAVMNGLHSAFAPETKLLPDLSIVSADDLHKLDEIFSANWFKGIDIVNYLSYWDTMSMADMKAICRKAREYGLTVKAHIGEFGSADDVMRYAEELELDQIQHGIAAVESPHIMNWLAKHKIQLNICPTSNILLGNSKSYATHQIRTLFDYGVPVTINTDDLLIFNATVSEEYLNLYNAGLMTAEELNKIRETGLASL